MLISFSVPCSFPVYWLIFVGKSFVASTVEIDKVVSITGSKQSGLSCSKYIFLLFFIDIDFEPPCEEEDDEETIEVEEQQEGNDEESQRKEIELLKQESTLPLDQLLSTLTLPQVIQELWTISNTLRLSQTTF